MVTHGYNSTDNLPSGGPPPIPPKSGQPSNAPPPIPPRKTYLTIEGRNVYIREAERQLNDWVLTEQSYTSKGDVVPYVVGSNLKFYKRAVDSIRKSDSALR